MQEELFPATVHDCIPSDSLSPAKAEELLPPEALSPLRPSVSGCCCFSSPQAQALQHSTDTQQMAFGIRSENQPLDALLLLGFQLCLPMGDAFASILHIPLNNKLLRSGGGKDCVG